MIRPFELRDFPILHRYRREGLFLDGIRTLTWGRTLVPAGAMLSPLASTAGVFTTLCFEDEQPARPLLAQVAHLHASPLARFTFLAPDSAVDSPALPSLVESLIATIGERGAHNLVAEVDEDTHSFEAMRRAGFSIYSHQRIWRFTSVPSMETLQTPWCRTASRDEINVRLLYNGLVPAFVQQVEPDPWERLRGRVYYRDSDLLAFADLAHGPRGVWVQPFVHPETEELVVRFAELIQEIRPRPNRPVYFCVRAYQAWIEQALEDLGAEASPRQAVMVRRLAVTNKVRPSLKIPAIERGRAEPTTPISSPSADAAGEKILIAYDQTPNY